MFSMSRLKNSCWVVLVVGATLLLLNACAPGLAGTLSLRYPLEFNDVKKSLVSEQRVYVEAFVDQRARSYVGIIGGRALEPEGDVGLAASEIFQEALKASGAKVVQFDAPAVISGAIQRWDVRVNPGFPTTLIKAQASLRIKIMGSRGKERYKAIYTGVSELKHPAPSQKVVEKVFAQAMQEAILEALRDQKLLGEIGGAQRE